MRRLTLVVLLAVALGLLLTVGTASASTTTNTIQWTLQVPPLFPGVPSVQDGTTYIAGSVLYCVVEHATGPDGGRFLGYAIVCLDRVIPPKGDNYHHGEIVFLSENPKSFWVPATGFWGNLAGHDLLWSGTWDGITRNKQNHWATITVVGWPGSDNEGYAAAIELHNGQYNIANAAATNYVDTPWNGVARVTGL